MFVPGIISLAFYKRKPSLVQVILGLVATIVLSALLGYISPGGPLGQVGSVIVAAVRGVIPYFLVLVGPPFLFHARRTQPPGANQLVAAPCDERGGFPIPPLVT